MPLFPGASFWISPTNERLFGGRTHINAVVKNERMFGFTRDELQRIYEKHDERFGSEGDSREEIIHLALQRDWIRVRKYNTYWAFTVDRLTRKKRQLIREFLMDITTTGIDGMHEQDRYMDVRVVEMDKFSGGAKGITVDDVIRGALMEGLENHGLAGVMNSVLTVH